MENQLNELMHPNLNFMKFSNIVTLFEGCKLLHFFRSWNSVRFYAMHRC